MRSPPRSDTRMARRFARCYDAGSTSASRRSGGPPTAATAMAPSRRRGRRCGAPGRIPPMPAGSRSIQGALARPLADRLRSVAPASAGDTPGVEAQVEPPLAREERPPVERGLGPELCRLERLPHVEADLDG